MLKNKPQKAPLNHDKPVLVWTKCSIIAGLHSYYILQNN
jgi:hypothetical protein